MPNTPSPFGVPGPPGGAAGGAERDRAGEPPPRHTPPRLEIATISVGPLDNNAYLLYGGGSTSGVLIDAANEADRLLELIRERGVTLCLVVTTHGHADHWQALADVVRATQAATAAHRLDAPALPLRPDRYLQDGDLVRVGSVSLEVIHLAGHTPGGLALLYRPAGGPPQLFTGDSLFPGGPGATRGDHQAFTQLMGDLERKVFDRLPDETRIHPGHGPGSTLGAERPQLGAWWARGY